jgi:hypothetical protein
MSLPYLAVPRRTFKASCGIRLIHDFLRHRLHHDEIDLRDFIITCTHSIERPRVRAGQACALRQRRVTCNG